jgi:hypothetical protein
VVLALALPTAASGAIQQGFIDGCTPQSPDCGARIQKLASGGFTLVAMSPGDLNRSNKDAAAVSDVAVRSGVKIIWIMSRGQTADAVVHQVGKLPATWGYYLPDEPTLADRGPFYKLADRLAQLDRAHQRLVMLCCGGRDTARSWSGTYQDWAGINAMLASDPYPIGGGPEMAQAAHDYVAGTTNYPILALQAWRQGDYYGAGYENTRFPTQNEITAMRDGAQDAVSQSTPKIQDVMILWFYLPDVIGPAAKFILPDWTYPTPPVTDERWSTVVGGASAAPGSWQTSTPTATPSAPTATPSAPTASQCPCQPPPPMWVDPFPGPPGR